MYLFMNCKLVITQNGEDVGEEKGRGMMWVCVWEKEKREDVKRGEGEWKD